MPNKIKLSRKRLYPSNSVKYLGVKIDENLTWKYYIYDIATKQSRASAILFKIRNYVNFDTLKSIYFAVFDSHTNYANLIWAQNLNSTFRIVTLQKKAIRIINNQPRSSHSSLLFKKIVFLNLKTKFKHETTVLNFIMFYSIQQKHVCISITVHSSFTFNYDFHFTILFPFIPSSELLFF